MAGGSITGEVAFIKWSYYQAATIQGYTLVRADRPNGSTWSVRATVVQADRFKLTQRPLTFVAPHVRGLWIWDVDDFTFDGVTLTAKLGRLREF